MMLSRIAMQFMLPLRPQLLKPVQARAVFTAASAAIAAARAAECTTNAVASAAAARQAIHARLQARTQARRQARKQARKQAQRQARGKRGGKHNKHVGKRICKLGRRNPRGDEISTARRQAPKCTNASAEEEEAGLAGLAGL